LLILASACTRIPDSIVHYEQAQHQIKVIKILNISNLEPFTAADSLTICNNLLQKQRLQLIDIQQKYIDSISIAITDAQLKADNVHDGTMKKAYALAIRSMENKRERAMLIISAYNNSPESTSLNLIICHANKYQQMGDSIIGFTQHCSFVGRQGALPKEKFQRKYLLSIDKQTVISEFTEP